jgi:hypothetical protein
MMRCEEVIRELAVPTDGRDDLAISRHLAGCETCVRWAEQAADLDRLWAATRPSEPSAESWDNLWSSLTAQLDGDSRHGVNGTRSVHAHALSAASLPGPSRRGRYWRGLVAVGLVGLAQAAALLVAFGVAWHRPVRSPAVSPDPLIVQKSAPGLDFVVDVEEGEVALIHSDGKKVRVDELASQDSSSGVDEWYLFFNVLEPMAKSVVAMTE